MKLKFFGTIFAALVLGGFVVLIITNGGMAKSIIDIVRPVQTNTDPEKTSSHITAPSGFTLSVFADHLAGARVLLLDPNGRIIVSQTGKNMVSVVLPDTNGDGKSDGSKILLENLNGPHGLAFSGNTLYVAEVDKVTKYDYDPTTQSVSNGVKLFDLPAGKGYRHTTRTLLIGPDPSEKAGGKEKLFISIGSSCDVCHEDNEQLATILVSDLDGKNLHLYAKGLRNSVFMALNPVTGALFATEMGRDWLGEDDPPDEINKIEKDKNYGWPVCFGNNMHDTEFDKNTYIRNPCMAPFETPAHIEIPAHSSPLGIAFVPEEGWPEEWWYHALVAYHGSWNRNTPTGYKIVRIPLDAKGNPVGQPVDFITGFKDMKSGQVYGRPVALLVLSGGVAYISDDHAGVIYKLSRSHE